MTLENETQEKTTSPADETIPSRSKLDVVARTQPTRPKEMELKKPEVLESKPVVRSDQNAQSSDIVSSNPPWTLQQFFNGEIDLDAELVKRFSSMPLMSTIHFRSLGTRTGRGVATLTTVDGAASVILDADAATHVVQMSFTFASMLTLRFTLDSLSDVDRKRWLELMRREQGGLAFLWGPTRWENDYVICLSRKYFTNLYAFSPNNFEAAIRMTPEVTKKLLAWLEDFWKKPLPEEAPPKLLTW
jgi:hypothetical protein